MGINPGGSMELGDSFEDCARREVQEETGLICGNLEHFMNVSGEEVHYVYPNGDEIYAAEEIFLCRKFSGQIICQQEEVEKLCFSVWMNSHRKSRSIPIIIRQSNG